ncbi:MAG: RIP metalloprotease RseP [Candidatus Nomurabacteria bacterium]|nr:RIP metalloprotease RseP [Candidatus Nomurabacteria bacterium]
MSIIIFITILLVLVVSHEFGHFIVAKKSGIRVDEFSFGFPPKLFGKKIGETTYNFNLLPVGGYVKIFGENPDEESLNGPDSKRSFINKPRYIQAAVLFAGVTMNFLVAWLLLSVGFMSGLPTSLGSVPAGATIENQALTITSVLTNSPASLGGLKVGDKISSLVTKADSVLFSPSNLSSEELQSFIKKHGNEEIKVSIVRGKESKEILVTPKINTKSDVAMIGISMDTIGTLRLPIHKAFWEGLKLTCSIMVSTILGFYNLIHNAIIGQGNMSSLTGPVGIVGVVGDAAKFGFIYLLSFTALISINLAVINLIPFPALDGGRLLFLLIEKIKGSPIKPQIANTINMVGFGILMILMVVITYHDIIKLL